MWGQVKITKKMELNLRIIPTRVGTRFDDLTDKIDAEDHPHACGDKRPILRRVVYQMGSSPRVWGQGF